MKGQGAPLTTFQPPNEQQFKGVKMATITWEGFQKQPTESLNVSYELITGQNLKPSSKEQSK